MQRASTTLLVLLIPTLAGAADPELMLTVDVPTLLGSTDYLGNQTVYKEAGSNTYALAFDDSASVPTDANIDALYLIEDGGCTPDPCYEFLFSVDAPLTIGGATFEPYDVIRHDLAGTYSLEWRPSSLSRDINVVAIGEDANGHLLVSFDTPTEDTNTGTTFQPADIGRVAGGVLQATKVFDGANDVSPGLDATVNIISLEQDDAGNLYLSFDNAVTDHGVAVRDLVVYNAASQGLSVYWSDSGFPATSAITGFSFAPSPGRMNENALTITKNSNGVDLDLAWDHGCSGVPDADKDYVVYEGTIGSFYDHAPQPSDCSPTLTTCGSQVCSTVSPGSSSHYYLVVPRNADFEGSYGTDSGGSERPASSSACAEQQMVRSCP